MSRRFFKNPTCFLTCEDFHYANHTIIFCKFKLSCLCPETYSLICFDNLVYLGVLILSTGNDVLNEYKQTKR